MLYAVAFLSSLLSPAPFAFTALPQEVNFIWLHFCWCIGSTYAVAVCIGSLIDIKQPGTDTFSPNDRVLLTEETLYVDNAYAQQKFNSQLVEPPDRFPEWWMIRRHLVCQINPLLDSIVINRPNSLCLHNRFLFSVFLPLSTILALCLVENNRTSRLCFQFTTIPSAFSASWTSPGLTLACVTVVHNCTG